MREALASYATRAAEKMRRYKVAADFIHANTLQRRSVLLERRLGLDERHRRVVAFAVRLGERLFRDGFHLCEVRHDDYEAAAETVQRPALWSGLDAGFLLVIAESDPKALVP